jgi:hypothetical protein
MMRYMMMMRNMMMMRRRNPIIVIGNGESSELTFKFKKKL